MCWAGGSTHNKDTGTGRRGSTAEHRAGAGAGVSRERGEPDLKEWIEATSQEDTPQGDGEREEGNQVSWWR